MLAVTPFKKRCQDVVGRAAAELLENLSCATFSVEPPDWRGIPVKRMRVETSVTYVSAIAHQWAPMLQRDPGEIAAAMIRQESHDSYSRRSPWITLSVEGSGWIWISIPDSEVVSWLQQMLTAAQTPSIVQRQQIDQSTDRQDIDRQDTNRQDTDRQSINQSEELAKETYGGWKRTDKTSPRRGHESIIRSQYAYARCCAWLRLADHAGLSPEQIALADESRAVEMPASGRQNAGIDHENFAMPSVMMPSVMMPLVMSLIDVMDEMDDWLEAWGDRPTSAPSSHPFLANHPQEIPLEIQEKALKGSHRLGDAALTLQAALPLIGVLRGGDRPRAEVLTALMLVTKSVLGCILRDWLGSQASDFL